MPVGANIRIGAAPADAAASPLEGASIEEIFSDIIATVSENVAAPAAGAETLKAATEAQQPATGTVGSEISAAVEQLLALLARQSGSSKDPAEVPAPTTEGDAENPENKPATVETTLAQLASAIAQPAPEASKPKTVLAAAATKIAAAPPAGPQAQPTPELPQIASKRTETVVQLALSNLEAAVKALPAQAWAAAAQPGQHAKTGEREPAPLTHEGKVAAPLTPTILTALTAAFQPTPAADPAQAAATAEPQPAPAEIAAEHQLDMAHEGEWLDRLAKDIAQTAGSEGNPLRFRLNPETLGTLRVEITHDRNGAAVRLTADTEAARNIIADAQPRLVAEARAQGIRISETHVDLGGQTASGDPRRQNAPSEEAPLRTARSLRDQDEGDGKPTPGRSERYA